MICKCMICFIRNTFLKKSNHFIITSIKSYFLLCDHFFAISSRLKWKVKTVSLYIQDQNISKLHFNKRRGCINSTNIHINICIHIYVHTSVYIHSLKCRVLWGSQHIGEATPGLLKSKKAKQKVKIKTK